MNSPTGALLELAVDAVADLVFIWEVCEGATFRCLFVNRAYLELRGYLRERLVGRLLHEIFPNYVEPVASRLREVVETRASVRFVELVPRPEGKVPMEIRMFPRLDESGRCTHVIGAAHDLTEQARLDEALSRSEARFRGLVEILPDAVFVHRDGLFLYANAAACRMLEAQSADALIGTAVADVVHPDDRARLRERTASLVGGTASAPAAEMRLVSRGGAVVEVEVQSHVLSFDGAPAVLALVRDLRARKEMEAQLQLADRMVSVGTLAAGVAHEINNPLGYVIGNLGYLTDGMARLRENGQDAGVDVAALQEALREVWDGAKRVRDIVNDLKTFSRTDVERRTAVDVKRTLEAALRMAQNELRHGSKVEVELGELPFVEGDASRLSQVFLNLLINAAQAMPERPASQNRIRVSARSEKRRVIVEVQDNGVGMTPEVKRRIFDPFFTTKPVGVGTGLGLSIVHSIVTSLRGEIAVESTPGAGTTFRISLPEAFASPRPPPPSEAPVPSDLHARVLVIDDEPLVGASIRRVLAGEHEVITLTDPAEALRRIRSGERYDVVLCDVMMPDMDGVDLHAELVRAAPEQADRMGFLTGGTFTRRASGFLERMADRTLAKPFGTQELRAFVRRLSKP